jgi:hypothetical protein
MAKKLIILEDVLQKLYKRPSEAYTLIGKREALEDPESGFVYDIAFYIMDKKEPSFINELSLIIPVIELKRSKKEVFEEIAELNRKTGKKVFCASCFSSQESPKIYEVGERYGSAVSIEEKEFGVISRDLIYDKAGSELKSRIDNWTSEFNALL